MIRLHYVVAVACLAACLAGCRKRNTPVLVPAPASQPTVAPAPPEQAPTPPQPPVPQQTPGQPPAQPTTPEKTTGQPPAQPTPPQKTPPSQQPRKPATQPVPKPADRSPVPRLGEVLTPEQRTQLLKEIDVSLNRANRSLAAIGKYSLNASQAISAEQIQRFIKQAEAMRNSDVTTAHSLASRAEVLARELLRSLE
jgi:hypothetical protein